MTQQKKQRPFKVDREGRKTRRAELRRVEHTRAMRHEDGREFAHKRQFDSCLEHPEGRQVVAELARDYASSIGGTTCSRPLSREVSA